MDTSSKHRPHWEQLPAPVRASIERLIDGPVVQARSCPGGFSPGFASRLTLAGGRRVFVKAMDAAAWPWDAALHRAEARTAAGLPASVPAPRLVGSHDDGQWIILAYEDVAGSPASPAMAAGRPRPCHRRSAEPRAGGVAVACRTPA